jgi:tetratricopeptide (TPR) repeat protein
MHKATRALVLVCVVLVAIVGALLVHLQWKAAQVTRTVGSRQQSLQWAIQGAKARMAKDPKDAEAYTILGQALADQRGVWDATSVALVRRAAELRPQDEAYGTSLASALYAYGDYQGAAAEWGRLAAAAEHTGGSPTEPEVLRHQQSAACIRGRDYAQGLAAARRGLSVAVRAGNREAAQALQRRAALCLWALGRHSEAEALYIAAYRAAGGARSWSRANPPRELRPYLGGLRNREPPPQWLLDEESGLGVPVHVYRNPQLVWPRPKP